MNTSLDPDNPHAWLARAHSNLKLAEIGNQQDVFLEDLCFEAQQAAEKAFKAVCVYFKVEFPKTHSLGALTGLLEQAGVKVPPELIDADLLTYFAVQTRYPGWDEAVSEAEYLHALSTARQVLSWAEAVLQEGV